MAGKKKTQSDRKHRSHKSGRVAATKSSVNDSDGLTPSDKMLSDGLDISGSFAYNDVAAVETSVTNGICYLLDTTAEIRQKIWRYAVKEEKTIYPRQVERKSNKFWPFKSDKPPFPFPTPNAAAQDQIKDEESPKFLLTAVQLSLTCHQIYDEIAGSGLFYQLNEFTFSGLDEVHLYLVAITPVRRNALRSVVINWDGGRTASRHALTMLATCEGLERVKVNLGWPYYWSYGSTQWTDSVIAAEMAELKGLKSFKMEAPISEDFKKYLPAGMSLEKCRIEVERVGKEIEAVVKQPREEAVNVRRIRAAEEASQLNIFGEGRLGPDKKPGIISSRTRGQLQKQKSLNDLGVIQVSKEQPKYSKFGDLLWDIKTITDSRELSSDAGGGRIEVKVTWAGLHDQSWEILDRIINSTNVIRVARFYVKHPEAYDIGVAVSTIKELVEKDDGKTYALDALTAVMKRNDSPEAAEKAHRLHRLRAFR